MNRVVGRTVFVIVIWLWSLYYFLECLKFNDNSEKITIEVAFFAFTFFSILEIINLIKQIYLNKNKEKIINKISIKERILDRRIVSILLIIIYFVCIDIVGFYSSSFILFTIFSIFLGTRKIFIVLSQGAFVTLCLYVIFNTFLKVNFPSGIFF